MNKKSDTHSPPFLALGPHLPQPRGDQSNTPAWSPKFQTAFYQMLCTRHLLCPFTYFLLFNLLNILKSRSHCSASPWGKNGGSERLSKQCVVPELVERTASMQTQVRLAPRLSPAALPSGALPGDTCMRPFKSSMSKAPDLPALPSPAH